MTRRKTMMAIAVVVVAGCRSDGSSPQEEPVTVHQAPVEVPAAPAKPESEPAGDQKGKNKANRRDRQGAFETLTGKGDFSSGMDDKDISATVLKAPAEPASAELGPKTRAWFPETFLFEPLVVTDAAGKARVEARVPDRLTSWRVLALAHSRAGAQAGAVTELLGTLPAYVDPIVPPFLMAGDRAKLPVQLVNTTGEAMGERLSLSAHGLALEGAGGEVRLGPGASEVRYASVSATRPGPAEISAVLGRTDAVVRAVEVRPTGRLVAVTASGTLAAPRSVELAGPAGADPAADRIRLLVFPGALALLRAELVACASRGGLADDAYGLLLAGRAPELQRALGDKPDPEALRALALRLQQRIVVHARKPALEDTPLLLEAAAAHGQSPVLQRLGERVATELARGQRPDGTFGGETGWSLQRVVVLTAEAVRAARAARAEAAGKRRAQALSLRAQGAFERLLPRIEDPYTAAAVLASGAVDGDVAEKLRAKIRAAVVERKDGARAVALKGLIERPDGSRASELEATALAVLALSGDRNGADAQLAADLGATLLAGYDPAVGWGDGRTNIACMLAVLRLFADPLPSRIQVTLSVDGRVAAEATLTRERVREVVALEAEGVALAGTHRYEIRAEPALPGLGYSLSLKSWVPWERARSRAGLELAVSPPGSARVGRPLDLELRAVVPAGIPALVRLGLPAGVQPDTTALTRLVEAGTIARYETADGTLTLHVPGLTPGQVFAARVRVIPTLAGTLHASASSLEAAGQTFDFPPAVWSVQ